MTSLQLAALCCLFLAYLTVAEKLPGHRGYNYDPPATHFNPTAPTYYIPPQKASASSHSTFIPAHSALIPPNRNHERPSFPQEALTHTQVLGSPNSHILGSSHSQIYGSPQSQFHSFPQSQNRKSPHAASRPSYNHQQENLKPMPFGYGYGVSDAHNGIDFGHNTNSDGKVTTGEYRVLLPDGRTQIVSYRVDDHKGYQADVTYEGEARPYEAPQRYDEPTNAYVEPQQTRAIVQNTFRAPETSYLPPQTVPTPDTLYRADF
ncbi:Cuticle Protein CPR RR Uncl [Hyalella azteca]|uniref:Cuticle Protein CPR RR Uncl n=1 Tax=Hyalella azteca TaxID=294128 RepID=A0A6A0HBI0_HYAAZ|nr:Cuticle Protein CPR RR Uncl [Hyalella azteca]